MRKYDTTKLAELGDRRTLLRTQLKEVQRAIEDEVNKAAKAGVIQAEIARLTGLTRESVAQLLLPPGQRWRTRRRPTSAS